jgi:mono/diheme cytochrome c family protein
MTRTTGNLLIGIALVLFAASLGIAVFAQAGPGSNPALAQHMREHFQRVGEVENAVIRGDLDAVREPATWLASHDSAIELGRASASQVATLKEAARKAADAKDIPAAATATAQMIAACGDCHRAAGVVPAPQKPAEPTVGGPVGHMLEHKLATDLLSDGLIVPSDTLWKQGAGDLKEAPLRPGQLPRDPKLTPQIASAEDRIHDLATKAAQATEEAARVQTYGQIISTCAQCHGLHGRVWGPGVPKQP